MPANLTQLRFIGNTLNIELKYKQIANYESTFLCLKDTEICVAQLTNLTNDYPFNISINSSEIKYGEDYVFDIKTIGCQQNCTKRSNEKSGRTGKY